MSGVSINRDREVGQMVKDLTNDFVLARDLASIYQVWLRETFERIPLADLEILEQRVAVLAERAGIKL